MKFIKEIMPYVVIVITVVLVRTFVITPILVSGGSMKTTLENNEMLLLNKYDKSYERFDIVVIDYDNGEFKEKLIKRIIGLPGEKIEYKDGKLYVDDKEVMDEFSSQTNDFKTSDLGSNYIPKNMYLVLGDNRNDSVDSRILGFINKDDIKGVAKIRLFPFNKFGEID